MAAVPSRSATAVLAASAAFACVALAAGSAAGPTGIREASWSPDGKHLAVSWFDAIWTMAPDGRGPKRVVKHPGPWVAERDPAWSPDGRAIAFSAETDGQFDIWVAPSGGGTACAVDLDARGRTVAILDALGAGRLLASTARQRRIRSGSPPGPADGRWRLFWRTVTGRGRPHP